MSVAGRFDAHGTGRFRVAFESLPDGPGHRVRVDLPGVVFVDSSALAELLRAQRTVRDCGGDLILVDGSGPVRIILELTGLAPVFTTQDGSDVLGGGHRRGIGSSGQGGVLRCRRTCWTPASTHR